MSPVARMEVRRIVIVLVHRDHDAEESADFRHGCLPKRVAVGGGDGVAVAQGQQAGGQRAQDEEAQVLGDGEGDVQEADFVGWGLGGGASTGSARTGWGLSANGVGLSANGVWGLGAPDLHPRAVDLFGRLSQARRAGQLRA